MKFGLQSTVAKRISRRYGQALFNLSMERKDIEKVYTDVVFLTEMLDSSADLRGFLANTQYAAELNESVLKELFKDRVGPKTFDFLLFLVQKGRLNILSEILRAFNTLYNKGHKIALVQITSAAALSDDQVKAICQKLEKRWQHTFIAQTAVNPDLIGGFQIRSGDEVLDFSMKNQLENFRRQAIKS